MYRVFSKASNQFAPGVFESRTAAERKAARLNAEIRAYHYIVLEV